MNELDSRFLRPGDTFAQRFTKAGTYHYNIGITGSLATAGHDAPFTLTVTAKAGATPQTHYVTVDYTNGSFTAAPTQLHINEGDAVLWSSTAPSAPGFSVYGQSKDERFDSAEIHANGMYSHAFGMTGEFEWRDAREGKLHGTITVEAHPICRTHEDRQAYVQKLSQATLIMIDHGHVRPRNAKITVGQTVFFAVKSAAGISIVDKKLVLSASTLNPQPLPP
jgi:plastocyanin